MNGFSVAQGFAAMTTHGDVGRIYLGIVLGVLMHFVWEILVRAVRTGQKPVFGPVWLIGARIAIALIVAVVSFTGIYKQVEAAEPAIRFFLAATQGFAIDALTSPVVPATTA